VLKAAFIKFKAQILKNIDISIMSKSKSAKEAQAKAGPIDTKLLSKSQVEEENNKQKLIAYMDM
jgi:hypothetical protein